jgi:hypothetical protein
MKWGFRCIFLLRGRERRCKKRRKRRTRTTRRGNIKSERRLM